MDGKAELKLLAGKILSQPARAGLIEYCPTMDLVAVVTDEEHLEVYRVRGGQRAFNLKRRGSLQSSTRVDAIRWKYNGR